MVQSQLPSWFKLLVLLWVISLARSPVLAFNGHSRSRLSSPGRSKNYCQNLLQRREWRTLSDDEKTDYIAAVKRMHSLPALHDHGEAVRTRFNEFQALHTIKMADIVHSTGQFLPWNRRFLQIYEDALRGECGYKGAIPYWDWTQDEDEQRSLVEAPVFDSTLLPDLDGVVRRVDASIEVAKIMNIPTFEQLTVDLEGRPVTIDHKTYDTNDPIFFSHHAFIDLLWSEWQQRHPSRLSEIYERSTTTPPFQSVTLDFGLEMGDLSPTIPIRDIVNIHQQPSCYTYV